MKWRRNKLDSDHREVGIHTTIYAASESSRKKPVPIDSCYIYMCFVDFEKAFDKVKHNKLWQTMVDMGFARHLVALIRS